MKKMFLKYYIIDALKGLYPSVELGKRDYSKEVFREVVPADFGCKNCGSCPYYKWEKQVLQASRTGVPLKKQFELQLQFERQFGR